MIIPKSNKLSPVWLSAFFFTIICSIVSCTTAERHPKIDVIIISGQSNAVGNGEFTRTGKAEAMCENQMDLTNRVLYRARLSTLTLEQYAFFADWGPIVERRLWDLCMHGVEYALVERLEKYREKAPNAQAAEHLAILKVAVGGTRLLARDESSKSSTPNSLVWMGDENLDDDLPQGVEFLAQEIDDAISDLRLLIPEAEVRLIAFVWMQGEHDVKFHSLERLKSYPTTFSAMVDDLFPMRENGQPLIIPIPLSPAQSVLTDPNVAASETIENFEAFNTQLRRLVDQKADNGWATITNLPKDPSFIKPDGIHYSAEGVAFIGEEIAEILIDQRALD